MGSVVKQRSERMAAVTKSGGKGEEDGRGENVNFKIGSENY